MNFSNNKNVAGNIGGIKIETSVKEELIKDENSISSVKEETNITENIALIKKEMIYDMPEYFEFYQGYRGSMGGPDNFSNKIDVKEEPCDSVDQDEKEMKPQETMINRERSAAKMDIFYSITTTSASIYKELDQNGKKESKTTRKSHIWETPPRVLYQNESECKKLAVDIKNLKPCSFEENVQEQIYDYRNIFSADQKQIFPNLSSDEKAACFPAGVQWSKLTL